LRLLRVLSLLLFAGLLQAQETQSALPTAAEINAVLKDLADITGFKIRKQLPFEMITRDQVNKYLKEQIKRNVKPDEIRAEEITLKKFGFVPPDFDLKKEGPAKSRNASLWRRVGFRGRVLWSIERNLIQQDQTLFLLRSS